MLRPIAAVLTTTILAHQLSTAAAMKVVVIGGGIQGTSVAYHVAQLAPAGSTISIVDPIGPATAASGKGGGFMARSWGNGSPTQGLHELAFDMYEDLAQQLDCPSYRKLPVLSVQPGSRKAPKDGNIPGWLDGKVGRIQVMGHGDDTAQITPSEFVNKMLAAVPSIEQVKGQCVGVVTDWYGREQRIEGVKVVCEGQEKETVIGADAVVVSAGPWSCQAEDWFEAVGVSLQLPMQGIKSTSIVWEPRDDVDATALFCGEDDRFGTHCEYIALFSLLCS